MKCKYCSQSRLLLLDQVEKENVIFQLWWQNDGIICDSLCCATSETWTWLKTSSVWLKLSHHNQRNWTETPHSFSQTITQVSTLLFLFVLFCFFKSWWTIVVPFYNLPIFLPPAADVRHSWSMVHFLLLSSVSADSLWPWWMTGFFLNWDWFADLIWLKRLQLFHPFLEFSDSIYLILKHCCDWLQTDILLSFCYCVWMPGGWRFEKWSFLRHVCLFFLYIQN